MNTAVLIRAQLLHSVQSSSAPHHRKCTQPHEISVHAWVVTKWPLQWLINHIKKLLKTFIRRPSLEDVFNFINIWRTNSIQVLNLHYFFCKFRFCPSKHILEIYLKNGFGTGRFPSETGSLWEQSKQKLKTKQTAVVPKKLSSISEPQLNYQVQNLARPTPHDIEMGHPCTGDVNAMVIWYGWLSVVVSANMIWSIDVDVWWIAPLVPIVQIYTITTHYLPVSSMQRDILHSKTDIK